jgi:hydrophobe/amphiphile efflux-3 (HAE3) family protein
MIVDPAVKRIPRTEKQREKLRAELRDNDLVYGSVVSRDFKHTAIVGFMNFKATDETALARLRRIIATNPGPEPVHIAGLPFLRVHLSHDIKNDMQKFLPIGIGIMLVFLLVCFRQLRGVLLPIVVTIMAIVVSMGLIPILGWKIQMVTVLLPVFLIAVANNYGIHVFARYQEDNEPGADLTSKELAHRGITELGAPVLATAVTTAAGVLSLLTHIIIPAKQMGILAAAGVIWALAASLLFIPAVLALLPRARPVLGKDEKGVEKLSALDRLLRRTATAAVRHPRGVLIGIVIFVVAVASGIPRIVVDTNPANFYDPDSDVAQGNDIVNANFGGATSVSAVAEGDIKDPKVMKQIDRLEQHMKAHPNVEITTSIAKVVREMNEVMNDGDKAFNKVPDTRDAIAQYFLLYSMSGDPDDFDKLVDFPYRHAQLTARINDTSTAVSTSVVEHAMQYLKNNPGNPFTIVGGFAEVLSKLVREIVRGQVSSLLLSMVLVSALVALLFRSALAGLLAAVPLALAMLLLFGLMGYLGIELNIPTAMLSSIMIGVGVDYTIHFLWRYREERRGGLGPGEAVRTALTTSGRGIVFNAFSVVVGFCVLIVSTFFPVRFFGILVVVSISACLVGALLLLPAILLIVRPRFLEPIAK